MTTFNADGTVATVPARPVSPAQKYPAAPTHRRQAHGQARYPANLPTNYSDAEMQGAIARVENEAASHSFGDPKTDPVREAARKDGRLTAGNGPDDTVAANVADPTRFGEKASMDPNATPFVAVKP